MNTTPTDELERLLGERIQRLADGVTAPAVPVEADLARGRRRQRRQRLAGVGGGVAALGAAAVVAGVTVGLPGSGTAGQQVHPASGGSGAVSQHSRPDQGRADLNHRGAKQREARRALDPNASVTARLEGYRAAIAEVLDPRGAHLDAEVTNRQVSGDTGRASVLGTKLGWKDGAGLGEIMVSVARPGGDSGGFSPYFEPLGCSPDAAHPCTPVRLPNGATGKQQRNGGELAVYYTRPDGQVVLIVESKLFGNNSRVPIAKLPATAPELLEAATDPRLTLGK